MSRPYISVEIDRNVRSMAKNRCGYCLSPQKLVMARLEIEHIIPVSKGGSSEESNLWLACPICNSHKAGKIEAIDPVTDEVMAYPCKGAKIANVDWSFQPSKIHFFVLPI